MLRRTLTLLLCLGAVVRPDPAAAGWIDPLPHDHIVYGLYPDGDTLRIRGTVSDSLGGVATAAPIALASSGAIASMPGLPFVPFQLLRHDGILYASGTDLYVWNGVTWELAWDSPRAVGPMVVHDGNLVVALFAPDDEDKIYSLVDGTWIPYTEHPILGYIDRMASFQGNLYVAGRFGRLGSVTARKIGYWDGSAWNALGVGLSASSDYSVGALVEYDGKLVVAGRFNSAGPVIVSGVAWWDGAAWGAFGPGSGLTGFARGRDAVVFGSDLVVVGHFDGYGTLPAPNVVRWTGAVWDSMASSEYGSSQAAAVWDGELWADFGFIPYDPVPSRLVRWDEPVTAAGGVPVPVVPALRAFPNPARSGVTLLADVPVAGPTRTVILDVRGRVVRRLEEGVRGAGPLRMTWDGADDRGHPLPAGVYVVHLRHFAGAASAKVLRLR